MTLWSKRRLETWRSITCTLAHAIATRLYADPRREHRMSNATGKSVHPSPNVEQLLRRWYRLSKPSLLEADGQLWASLPVHDFVAGELSFGLRYIGHGAPVLLVHGEGGYGAQFGALAQSIAGQGFCAWMIDLNGAGARENLRLSVNDIAHAVLRASELIGGVRAAVVHSMGNMWTWAAIVAGLRLERLAAMASVSSSAWLWSQVQGLYGLEDDTLAQLRQALKEAEGPASLSFCDPLELAKTQVRPPRGLVLHGTADNNVPVQQGRAYAAAWPDAQYLELQGVTHNGILTRPETFSAIGRFLCDPVL